MCIRGQKEPLPMRMSASDAAIRRWWPKGMDNVLLGRSVWVGPFVFSMPITDGAGADTPRGAASFGRLRRRKARDLADGAQRQQRRKGARTRRTFPGALAAPARGRHWSRAYRRDSLCRTGWDHGRRSFGQALRNAVSTEAIWPGGRRRVDSPSLRNRGSLRIQTGYADYGAGRLD